MNNSSVYTQPKILRDKKVIKNLLNRINEPHVKKLNNYVKQLRKNGLYKIPYFDPNDGGTDAKVLFLLEAPGRKAI